MPGQIGPCFVALTSDQPTAGGRLILPDRTTAQLRAAAPEDEDALHSFFERLSPESRRRRFLSAALPRPELIASLCNQKDPRFGSTLLVIHMRQGEPYILATGSYLAKGKQSAEVALAVEDAFQGKGLGTLLLKRLAAQAVRNGFTRFWAITQADNEAMRDVFRDSGFAIEERQEGNEIEVNLSIVPGKNRGPLEDVMWAVPAALGMAHCDENASRARRSAHMSRSVQATEPAFYRFRRP